jgi:hypothetical protein
MAGSNVKVSVDVRGITKAINEAKKAAELGMNDAIDDLTRVSSEIAPHDKGILEKSHAKEIRWKGDRIEGEVAYNVKESSSGGNYNYALRMHEDTYKLGEGSEQKPGAQGMSGKSYDVGNKYLTRPLDGESKAYRDHIADEIRKDIRKAGR